MQTTIIKQDPEPLLIVGGDVGIVEDCKVCYFTSNYKPSKVNAYYVKTQHGIEKRGCARCFTRSCAVQETFCTTLGDQKQLEMHDDCVLHVEKGKDGTLVGCFCRKHLATPCFAAVNYCSKPLLTPYPKRKETSFTRFVTALNFHTKSEVDTMSYKNLTIKIPQIEAVLFAFDHAHLRHHTLIQDMCRSVFAELNQYTDFKALVIHLFSNIVTKRDGKECSLPFSVEVMLHRELINVMNEKFLDGDRCDISWCECRI